MRAALATALALCGCDRVFGISGVQPAIDAPPGPLPIDAFVILTPPDGATSCGPPIDFTSWVFDPIPAPAQAIYAMTAYATPLGEHVIFAGADPPGTTYRVFDWDFATMPAPIASLDPPTGAQLGALGLSPDANILWFAETMVDDGTYYATRASGWTKHRIDLGLSDPDPQVGAIGYYDGTARMVVAIDPGQVAPHLTELASTDGLSWTAMTGAFPTGFDGFVGVNDPSLTADGCTLIFSGVTQSFEFNLYSATRDASGAFAAPIQIPAPQAQLGAPALSTDRANLWFISSTTDQQLVHAHP